MEIHLPKNFFYNGQNDHSINLEISEPRYELMRSRKKIGSKEKGVYVIFDKMGGENWETENPSELTGEKRHCLYVGEGIIRTRLNKHSHTLIGRYAGEVIYYIVPDIADRKLFERILIKHFVPIFNKEGQYPHDIEKKFMDDRDKLLEDLLKEINDKQIEVGLEPSGKEIIEDLFNDHDLTLDEIKSIISDIHRGLDKQTNELYLDKTNWH